MNVLDERIRLFVKIYKMLRNGAFDFDYVQVSRNATVFSFYILLLVFSSKLNNFIEKKTRCMALSLHSQKGNFIYDAFSYDHMVGLSKKCRESQVDL